MGIDFHLIANFAALFLITVAGPAVIFILFYRRGALCAFAFKTFFSSPQDVRAPWGFS